jgi:hypothetical protein
MKSTVTISLFLIVLGFQSCQSEYSERMSKAIALKQRYIDIKNIMIESNDENLEKTLDEIEDEIKFQAKISGNEELFLKEIWKH